MGSVYKARDRELDRLVALKVIRSELGRNPEIVRRFKQELILARQVTHKNVVRIFDLGEADGIKFITMEYIEGRNLKTLLRQKSKYSPQEAVELIKQVCHALDAAHTEGVVHRDLKPQNIMVDSRGKVSVMDFGIARSIEMPGMTLTGVLVGTPEYMSPEQARGEELDARSDLFALGIVFYELLTGKSLYQADTALASLWKRTTEPARPPVEIDPTIPRALSDVAMKCLQIDVQQRYQTAQEILKDLEASQEASAGLTLPFRRPRFGPLRLSWKWGVAGLTVLLLALAGFLLREKIGFGPLAKPGASVEQVSLAILPFRNASGDKTLDWLGPSVAALLTTEVGQSPRLRTVSSDRLHQILRDLRIAPDSNLDPETLRRLGDLSNAKTLVSGQYLKFGDQIRMDATIFDLERQRTIVLKVEAPNEKDLLRAIQQLAQSIQQNVASSTDILKELRAKSFKPSSQSLQALRYYNEGLQFIRQGNQLEAVKQFEASTKEDPQFALAYSKLGETYSKLGSGEKAEQSSRKAVELGEKLPPQEKYLIAANHAVILNDRGKAIESYENLAKVSPDDLDIQISLAKLYEDTSAFDQAHDHYARVLARDPKHVEALLAVGRVEIKRGNPQGSLEFLTRALNLAIQLENEEEKATIQSSIGAAYKRLNRPGEAVRYYLESLEIKRRLGQKAGIATALTDLAALDQQLGRPDDALKGFKEALQLRREIGDTKSISNTLVYLGNFYLVRGQYDAALQRYKESLQIYRELGNVNGEALCANNIGKVYFMKAQYEDALTYYERALELREKSKVPGEIAMALRNLGDSSAQMGRYEAAFTYYHRALELYRGTGNKREAAMASYSMAGIFAIQGRFRAALDSTEEALKTLRELADRSTYLANVLNGYGNALSQIGRGEEAQKTLQEALKLSRELQSKDLTAQALIFQGDDFFYRGDFKPAQAAYEQALQTASQTANRNRILLCKVNLAKVASKQGRPQAALSSLRGLAQQADAVGEKSLSTECAIYSAEALINMKEYSRARQQLEPLVPKSEKLGGRLLFAKACYLLATSFRLTGNHAEARRYYGEALRALDEMRKEAQTETFIKRHDLALIYEESHRWSSRPRD